MSLHPQTFMKRRGIPKCGLVALALVLASPLLARLGYESEIASWSAPTGTWEHPHAITLRIERLVAYADILRGYGEYRLIITDRGYAYTRDFAVPTAEFRKYALNCQVTWHNDRVEIHMPTGERLVIPSETVLRQL